MMTNLSTTGPFMYSVFFLYQGLASIFLPTILTLASYSDFCKIQNEMGPGYGQIIFQFCNNSWVLLREVSI